MKNIVWGVNVIGPKGINVDNDVVIGSNDAGDKVQLRIGQKILNEDEIGQGGGTSDYKQLLNKPIIEADLEADGFLPVEGEYYLHKSIGGDEPVYTPFEVGQTYDKIYFDTSKSVEEMTEILSQYLTKPQDTSILAVTVSSGEPVIAIVAAKTDEHPTQSPFYFMGDEGGGFFWASGDWEDLGLSAGWQNLESDGSYSFASSEMSEVTNQPFMSATPFAEPSQFINNTIYHYINGEYKNIDEGGSAAHADFTELKTQVDPDITISDASMMASLLVAENEGKYIKYTGPTTEDYESGAVYTIKPELIGTPFVVGETYQGAYFDTSLSIEDMREIMSQIEYEEGMAYLCLNEDTYCPYILAADLGELDGDELRGEYGIMGGDQGIFCTMNYNPEFLPAGWNYDSLDDNGYMEFTGGDGGLGPVQYTIDVPFMSSIPFVRTGNFVFKKVTKYSTITKCDDGLIIEYKNGKFLLPIQKTKDINVSISADEKSINLTLADPEFVELYADIGNRGTLSEEEFQVLVSSDRNYIMDYNTSSKFMRSSGDNNEKDIVYSNTSGSNYGAGVETQIKNIIINTDTKEYFVDGIRLRFTDIDPGEGSHLSNGTFLFIYE